MSKIENAYIKSVSFKGGKLATLLCLYFKILKYIVIIISGMDVTK